MVAWRQLCFCEGLKNLDWTAMGLSEVTWCRPDTKRTNPDSQILRWRSSPAKRHETEFIARVLNSNRGSTDRGGVGLTALGGENESTCPSSGIQSTVAQSKGAWSRASVSLAVSAPTTSFSRPRPECKEALHGVPCISRIMQHLSHPAVFLLPGHHSIDGYLLIDSGCFAKAREGGTQRQ